MSATLITFGADITRAPMLVPVPPVTSSKAPGKMNLKFLFFINVLTNKEYINIFV